MSFPYYRELSNKTELDSLPSFKVGEDIGYYSTFGGADGSSMIQPLNISATDTWLRNQCLEPAVSYSPRVPLHHNKTSCSETQLPNNMLSIQDEFVYLYLVNGSMESDLNHSMSAVSYSPCVLLHHNKTFHNETQLPGSMLSIQGNSKLSQLYGDDATIERQLNTASATSSSNHSFKLGDMLRFCRGLYSHFGIYVGAGELVHLSGVNGSMESGPCHVSTLSGVVCNKGIVRRDNVWHVAGVMGGVMGGVMINVKDAYLQPLNSSEILNRTLSKVGEVGYNLFFKNCEHFATWCRYDREESDQVNLVILLAVIFIVVVGLVLAGLQFR